MKIALRIVLALGGLLLLYMGFGFLTDPVSAGAGFGLTVEGAHGTTSVRSDFTAFFGVSGAAFLWGAWKQHGAALVFGAALMLVTLAGRLVSLAIDGSFEGYIVPMVVELVLGVGGLVAAKILPEKT